MRKPPTHSMMTAVTSCSLSPVALAGPRGLYVELAHAAKHGRPDEAMDGHDHLTARGDRLDDMPSSDRVLLRAGE